VIPPALAFWLRGRLNVAVTRLRNRGARTPLAPPAPLEAVLRGEDSPLALSRLLAGRDNAAREAAVARYLAARDVPIARQRFASFEGRGENFAADVGSGDRVLLLIAHHDAVAGSPGANDNAAAVGLLLHLLPRLRVPGRLRVRLLFTACEEVGYLGARAWVRDHAPGDLAGVLSLELCGVGDSVAIWDAGEDGPFLRQVRGALEGLGLRRDESYHVVGRIPLFGSDHRAFAAAGVPAYGLTVIPAAEAEALRAFIFSPMRNLWKHVRHRPAPFDTYHTGADAVGRLDPRALDLVARALQAVVEEVG
jgi:hypothetical protein